MTAIQLDVSHFPLVISTFPATWNEADLDAYFAAFTALHAREKPFIHINDISLAENMSKAGMRKKAGDFMAAERERSARLCRGAVQVAPSAALRGALTAISWIAPPPYAHATVATRAEADALVKTRAEAVGLVLPAGALR